jgi:hypothetical protein
VKITSDFESGECLDPIALLDDLLPHIKSLDIPLAVTISDGEKSISYLLSIFTSREYEVRDGFVLFGLKKLKLKNLNVNISFDLNIVSDENSGSI